MKEDENYNSEYEYDDYDQQPDANKSLKGYKVLIIILIVVLGVLSGLYFRQMSQLKADFKIERDTLTNRISNLITDIDNIKVENDSMNMNLSIERDKADSLMSRLKSERSTSRATIRQYEKELGTLRSIMRGYLETIDSLDRLNQSLAAENISYRKQVTSLTLRAEAAEESSTEYKNIIRSGSVIKARDITISALNASNRAVTRVSRAVRLKVDCVLSANEIAQPGERMVYVRIIGPDGYVLANDSGDVFDFEGDKITYSAAREVDYTRNDLGVGIYYNNGSGIVAGTYQIIIYIDGSVAGSSEVVMK